MSIADVRAALKAYFVAGCAPGTGSVPGVSTFYGAIPWFVAGSQWELSTDFGSGAIAFLHLEDLGETRIADPSEGVTPGVVGMKLVEYQVDLVVLYQFLIPSASQADAAPPDSWIDPLDATMQALKDLIHADPTAGTGPNGTNTRVIFEMGQQPGDLKVPPQLPMRTPAKIWTWPVLQFSATEAIFA
jgi:hypothetical protein